MSQYGDPIQTFWVVPSERVLRKLRRYDGRSREAGGHDCPGRDGYHNASARIEPAEGVPIRRSYDQGADDAETSGDTWPHDDPRWPTNCAGCDYLFTDRDEWQLFAERMYVRADGEPGEYALVLRNDADHAVPAGAMWDAWWYPDGWKVDGVSLVVMLPDRTPWTVDGPSSSCTARSDGGEGHDTRTGHRCWTRTGDPTSSPPTVDANPSIASGHPETYHGYLRHGQLVSV